MKSCKGLYSGPKKKNGVLHAPYELFFILRKKLFVTWFFKNLCVSNIYDIFGTQQFCCVIFLIMHIALTHVNIYIYKSLKPLQIAICQTCNHWISSIKQRRNSKFWTMDKYDPLGTSIQRIPEKCKHNSEVADKVIREKLPLPVLLPSLHMSKWVSSQHFPLSAQRPTWRLLSRLNLKEQS